MDHGKVKGMLWGLIVGDAFGSPIQFSRKDGHPWITEMVPCPVFNLPAGYWTDDGSMAMCVMDSFVRKGGYDLKDIGDTFEEGLIAAVNLGGDSDSIGAVFGQIAGSFYGFDAIPERWVKGVKDWGVVDKLIEDFYGKLS